MGNFLLSFSCNQHSHCRQPPGGQHALPLHRFPDDGRGKDLAQPRRRVRAAVHLPAGSGSPTGTWGWRCLFEAINEIGEERLDDIVYIRNEGHTVTEALNRQLAHYAYHIGQIVYIARMIQGGKWTSLSIPRNQSGDYNSLKFAREKGIRHFTEDELERDLNLAEEEQN